jgi:hypothetical protein
MSEGALQSIKYGRTFRDVALSILAHQINLHFVIDLGPLIHFVLCDFPELAKAVRLHIAHEIAITIIATLSISSTIISTLIAHLISITFLISTTYFLTIISFN